MLHKARKDYINMFLVYGVATVFVVGLSYLAQPYDHISILRKEKQAPPFFVRPDAFADIQVTAKAYVVYDIVGGQVIAAHNEQKELPLASLTKIMTAYTSKLISEEGGRATITISPSYKNLDFGLQAQQSWKLSELLKYMLVFSSNDAADIIADTFGGKEVFVARMNALAVEKGMQLFFTSPSGLDTGSIAGGKGSAVTVARLLALVRQTYPELFDATTHTRVTVRTQERALSGIPNTNQSINQFFGAVASKTGFTDNAGGNLAIIVDPTLGRPVCIVVLGSTREDRFTDVYTLYQALRKSY